MKKLLFGLVAMLMMSNVSLGQNELPNTTIKEIDANDHNLKELKEWYLSNTKKIRTVDKITFGKSYLVSPDKEEYFYTGIEVFENLNLDIKYSVKSYLIDTKLKKESELKHLKYLQRVIKFEKKSIVQIINVITGEQIDNNLVNLTEEEYNSLRLPGNSGGGNLICYKSLGSCIRHMNNAIDNPFDQAVCDWVPCATAIYLACQFSNQSGWMQNTSDFVGAARCKVIY